MEDLKQLASHNSLLQLSKALQKIEKLIEQQKKDPTKKESTIAELNFLKEQCVSSNVKLSLLSCQTLYGLVENGVLEAANVLTMFITMLPNANSAMKISAIGEGIFNILLLDLKITCLRLKSSELYICPFGIKNAQHPLITLILKKNIDIMDFANKLNVVCSHSDVHIESNSIEFLRPVFLHALCNPFQNHTIEPIWRILIKKQNFKSSNAQRLQILHEIFAWYRVTPESGLSLSTHLIDVIELCLATNNSKLALEYLIYLIALVISLIEFGYDPRNAFSTISKTIQLKIEQIDEEMAGYMLITMSQIIHNIAPLYLRNSIEIIKVLIEQNGIGNIILSNIILDCLIVRLAINGKQIEAQAVNDIQRLIKRLLLNTESNISGNLNKNENESIRNVQYFHPSIAMNFNLIKLSDTLSIELKSANTIILKRFINFVSLNKEFANEVHFMLRSILLSMRNVGSLEIWSETLEQLVANAEANVNNSGDTIYFMLHLLANETDGRKQVELLRGLTKFANIKENIPMILNTFRLLSSSSSIILRMLSVELHTQLWLVEKRTYQFLHKILISDDDDELSTVNKWEMDVVKANTIKQICALNASQYGIDLVAPLSKILNRSLDNDLASSLALDAVVWLCKSHTVNIVSTWKVLRGVFESKLKTRTTKSLCEFFGEVPLLKSLSTEYDNLFREALNRLWNFITGSNDVQIIQTAFRALRNFDFSELTLQHLPIVFYENVKLPREYQLQIAASHSDPTNAPLTAADVVPYIPGECWIELLKHIDQDALVDAKEFVEELIETEMSQYRSGVYMLAEGRPEPKELQHLHVRSPLQAMVKFLYKQSEIKSEHTTARKCLECVARKFSRPIPPLNWFFLIEYINQGSEFESCSIDDQFEMKKYALKIAGNQIAHSGSAKTLVENYLQSFNASDKEFEEIEMALYLVSNVCASLPPRVLATFVHDTMDFLHGLSAYSNFEEGCHFEIGLKTIARVFDTKCLIAENIDIIADEICRFNYTFTSDSKIYDRYSSIIMKLPSESLDRLGTPVEWNANNFRKSLRLRSMAISSQKAFVCTPNAWMWINLLIDNISQPNDSITNDERKNEFLAEVLNLLTNNRDETSLNEWIMYFLGRVQSNLSQETTNDGAPSFFSLDMFMLCVVVGAGCATFVTDKLNMANRIQWIDKFPEAVLLLQKRPIWTNHLPRVFEFLYHLKTQQKNLPDEYNPIICNALICVKNNEYFLQKSTWIKFISLK